MFLTLQILYQSLFSTIQLKRILTVDVVIRGLGVMRHLTAVVNRPFGNMTLKYERNVSD